MAKYKYEVSVDLDLTNVQNPGVYQFELQERYNYVGRVYASDFWHSIFIGNTFISNQDINRGSKVIYITDLISSRKWDGLEYTTTNDYREEIPVDESCVVPLYNEYRIILTVEQANITSTVANVQFFYRYHNGSTDMFPTLLTSTGTYGDVINPLLQGYRITEDSEKIDSPLIPHIPYLTLTQEDNNIWNFPFVFNWNNNSETDTYYINFHGLVNPTINKQAVGVTTAFPTFCHKIGLHTLFVDTQYNPEGTVRPVELPIVPFNQGAWTYWTYDDRRNSYFLPSTWSTSYNITFNFIINMTSGLNVNEMGRIWNPNNLGAVYQLIPIDVQTIKNAIAQGDSIQYFTIEVYGVVDGEGNIARMKIDIDNAAALEDIGKHIDSWKFYPQQYGIVDTNYQFKFESTIDIPYEQPSYIDINGRKLAYIDICPANYYIVWQDRGGSYQCQPFNKTETYSESLKRNTWNRWDGEERYSTVEVQPKWKLNSGWIDESLMPYYESLYVSNNIQLWDIRNKEVIDCVLKANNFTEKTFKNQGRKLFNIEVELSESKIQNILY